MSKRHLIYMDEATWAKLDTLNAYLRSKGQPDRSHSQVLAHLIEWAEGRMVAERAAKPVKPLSEGNPYTDYLMKRPIDRER